MVIVVCAIGLKSPYANEATTLALKRGDSGQAALRLACPSLDRFPRLVKYHITIDGKIREVAEDGGADQHRLAIQHLGDVLVRRLDASQPHMSRHHRQRGQLRD